MNFRIYVGVSIALALSSCGLVAMQKKDIEGKFEVYTLTDDSDNLYVKVDNEVGYAFAEGVWTVEGDDKIASPINISRISCNKSENYCEDNRSYILSGAGRPTLMAQSELYTITTWTADKVTAELMDPDCRTIQLEISSAEKSVTTVTRQRGECGGRLPKLETPRLGVLITGKQLDKQRGL